MPIQLTRGTRIAAEKPSAALRHAIADFERDLAATTAPRSAGPTADVRLVPTPMDAEAFRVRAEVRGIRIEAADDLGFVYGLYAVSRELLGVTDLWFWNDQRFTPRPGIPVPDDLAIDSTPAAVRYRGWFINDEVLLAAWTVDRDPDAPWQMAFEALLRLGGNVVIPGTDARSHRMSALASERGLIIAQHHAEPLGAEMFVRAYPGLTASYEEHPDKFEALWQRSIDEHRGERVIWNLGFRGQGDRPFWEDDPRYATTEARGALLSGLIAKQYEMVKASDPDAECCVYLYGEAMELYRDGALTVPEHVIRVWADNGFGRMVSRRQENHNPRVDALAPVGNRQQSGIYYHASFYDLQAANHITMLPNDAQRIADELRSVLDRRMDDFWIVNCSNVKPHVYFLDLIARLWREGRADARAQRLDYARAYYGDRDAESVAEAIAAYAEHAVPYGPHWDDHAGEQFPNFVPRMLVSQYLANGGGTARSERLQWATDAADLPGQVAWFRGVEEGGEGSCGDYLDAMERTRLDLVDEAAAALFHESLELQAAIHRHCYAGALAVARSLELAFAGEHARAFYAAGCARRHYLRADAAMRDAERGKWVGFYANECLTDVKQSAWVLEGLMAFVRNLGDGPHFYSWQREFLYSAADRDVVLITNLENHLRDGELFTLMDARWGDSAREEDIAARPVSPDARA